MLSNKLKNNPVPSKSITEERIWKILENYFKTVGLVHQQISSFNNYIGVDIQNVVNEEADIVITPKKGKKYILKFGHVYIGNPSVIEEDRKLRFIFPIEARQRDLNYDAAIHCDLHETFTENDKIESTRIIRRVVIGRTPIMVGSSKCKLYNMTTKSLIKAGECEFDKGGYFIIKGNERAIVTQLRANHNQTMIFKQKEGEKISHTAEIRSMSEETGHSVLIKAFIGSDDRTITFSLPYVKEPINVGIVFKALGFIEEQDIVNLIGLEGIKITQKYIRFILRDSYSIKTQKEALEHIGKYIMHIVEKKTAYALQVVETELFPHLGVTANIKEKAMLLGTMIKKLLLTKLGIRNVDDRDNYSNKRIETTGILCADLFRTLFKRYTGAIKLQLEKKKNRIDIISIVSRLNSITTGLKHSFSTGNWGVKNSYIKSGVSQVMSRMTYGATLSHLRRIIFPIGKEGKNAKIRQIHSSQFGFICPAETPEGQSAGVVLNFSLLTNVTKKIPTYLVKELIEKSKNICNISDIELIDIKNTTYVYLNGILMGSTKEPEDFVDEIKKYRNLKVLHSDISITYDVVNDEVRIFCDEGRAIRPLFNVENGHLKIKNTDINDWNTLVKENYITYADNSEVENSVISMTQETLSQYHNDYCEIHPSMILGVMGSIIPFPDHSQSPRNCYQCLNPEELVVMSDNSLKKIGDIKIGEQVITIDITTCESSVTTVTHHYIKKNNKQIIQLITETGRTIKCTEDHRILTPNGWVEASNANIVCIIPTQTVYKNNEDKISYNLPDVKPKIKHRQELINMGLFPVKPDAKPIVARMIGFLLSDGSAGIYRGYPQIQMTFGSVIGRKMFEQDVRKLGWSTNKVVKVYSEKYGKCEQIIYNNSLASLLIGLTNGYVGKRTTQIRQPLMKWITEGSKLVKREFLAGFQGGDGCKIRYNILPNRKSGNFVLNSTSQTSKNIYIDSLINFMNQLKHLFSEFDIKCTGPKIRNNDTDDSKCVHMYFSNTRENLIKYFENIGWRYDDHKYSSSLPIYEYLKYCQYQISKIIKERELIRYMMEKNKSPTNIAKELGKKNSYIRDSIRSIKNNRKPRMTNKSLVYQTWIKNKIIKNGVIFVNIDKRTSEPDGLVCDITINSKNHSFIAGDSFCVHNCSMGKQALGIFALSYPVRTDTISHVLDYPQRPLVSTKVATFMGFDEMPSGINAIVAICCYTGYNQEDSLIMSQSAIDRGLFRVTTRKTISYVEKKEEAYVSEHICIPPKNCTRDKNGNKLKPEHKDYFRRKNGNFSLLGENGVVIERVPVYKGDIIIGLVEITNDKYGVETKKDKSISIKSGEEGYIEKVYVSTTPNGYKMVKIIIRKSRVPERGDKFASREAQKGTVGITYRQEDLPFNEEGITPDIIINPHAIPSRMTVNQLMECVLGKACAISGTYGDATPFTSNSDEKSAELICNLLQKAGMNSQHAYDKNGWETMTSGITGEQLKSKIFMGPTYYQRLKHMVSDKIHSRAEGQVTSLTRQPTEGRSRDGGLRFGEMERDCEEENTLVSLSTGLSCKIKYLENSSLSVYGWDKDLDGMTPSKQLNFLYKGERECVELTFQDGRNMECTPDHPVLTTDGKWVKAKDLEIGKRVKSSVIGAEIVPQEEIKLCENWSLTVGKLKFDCSDYNNYIRSMALTRFIGYLSNDGHIRNGKMSIFLGHQLDVNQVEEDLKLFCVKSLYTVKFIEKREGGGNIFVIKFKKEFSRDICKIKGLIFGAKVGQPSKLPEFATKSDCPLPILREFLGGLYGADGHTCVLAMHRGKRDLITSVGYSKTNSKEFSESLVGMIEEIQKMLGRFGITNTNIQKLKETTHSKKKLKENKHYQSTLQINVCDLLKFTEKIGFRYCCHKTVRLEAGSSYYRLRENVKRQRMIMVNRVDEITNYKKLKEENPTKIISTKKAIEQSIKDLEENEILIHKYSIPTRKSIKEHLVDGTKFSKFRSKSFPTAEEYLTEIEAIKWFDGKFGVDRNDVVIPVMNLKLIGRREIGEQKVYDIQVENTESFLANGIVVHNCMIAHGASSMLKERLFDVSDAYQIIICNKCGQITSSKKECVSCNTDKISMCNFPYAAKLLVQEIQAMNIKVEIKTN